MDTGRERQRERGMERFLRDKEGETETWPREVVKSLELLNSLCEEINNFVDAGDLHNAPQPGSINTNRTAAVELDVAGDGEVIKLAVEKAWKCFGCIDALVNNAGIRGGTKSSLYLSEEEWNNVVRTNLTGYGWCPSMLDYAWSKLFKRDASSTFLLMLVQVELLLMEQLPMVPPKRD